MAYIRDKYPRPSNDSTASESAAGPSKLTPTIKTGAAKKPAEPMVEKLKQYTDRGSTVSQPAAGPSKLTPAIKTGAAKKPAEPMVEKLKQYKDRGSTASQPAAGPSKLTPTATTKLVESNMVTQLREAAAGKTSGQRRSPVSPANRNLTALTKAFNAAKKKSGSRTAQDNASAVNALKETLQNTKKKNLNP